MWKQLFGFWTAQFSDRQRLGGGETPRTCRELPRHLVLCQPNYHPSFPERPDPPAAAARRVGECLLLANRNSNTFQAAASWNRTFGSAAQGLVPPPGPSSAHSPARPGCRLDSSRAVPGLRPCFSWATWSSGRGLGRFRVRSSEAVASVSHGEGRVELKDEALGHLGGSHRRSWRVSGATKVWVSLIQLVHLNVFFKENSK